MKLRDAVVLGRDAVRYPRFGLLVLRGLVRRRERREPGR